MRSPSKPLNASSTARYRTRWATSVPATPRALTRRAPASAARARGRRADRSTPGHQRRRGMASPPPTRAHRALRAPTSLRRRPRPARRTRNPFALASTFIPFATGTNVTPVGIKKPSKPRRDPLSAREAGCFRVSARAKAPVLTGVIARPRRSPRVLRSPQVMRRCPRPPIVDAPLTGSPLGLTPN